MLTKLINSEVAQIGTITLVGVGLALWSNPQWYYNPEKEYIKTGVKLLKNSNMSVGLMERELEKNFLTFHNWEGTGAHDYIIKKQALELNQNLAKDLTEASYEIHSMCLEVVERVCDDDVLLELFEIPDEVRELCKESWKRRETDLLGRFDFIYDGKSKPKLLEYNADTPTLLIESGIGQKIMNSYYSGINNKPLPQFNFIDNSVMFFWKNFIDKHKNFKKYMVIGDTKSEEEFQTIKYMNSMLEKARDSLKNYSIDTGTADIELLSYLPSRDETYVVDTNLNRKSIDVMWKLYPYEWLTEEGFGSYLEKRNIEVMEHPEKYEEIKLKIIEPYWKLILSSKALLPFLWEMFPNHPNLLPAYFEHPKKLNNKQAKKDCRENSNWIKKPKFGREGYNIEVAKKSDESDKVEEVVHSNDSNLMKKVDNVDVRLGNPIYQAFCRSIKIQRMFPTFGVWVINGLPAGIGIRLCNNKIANTHSSFVPHYFHLDKTFNFQCTEAQKDYRQSLYGEDKTNALEVYQDFAPNVKFGTITKDSEYYRKYYSRTELKECHCGGGCGSYNRAGRSYYNRYERDPPRANSTGSNTGSNSANANPRTEHKGGRKFPKQNKVRMATGRTGRAFSSSS